MDDNIEGITNPSKNLPDIEKFKASKENGYNLGKIIGRAIGILLEEKEITQRELAKSIFVSSSMISKMIKGEVNPSIENIVKIAEYFEVSIDYLCGRDWYENSCSSAMDIMCKHLYAGWPEIKCDEDEKTYHIPCVRISSQLADYWAKKRKAERLRISAIDEIDRQTAKNEKKKAEKNLLDAIKATRESSFDFSDCNDFALIPKEKLTSEIAKFLESRL